MSQAEERVRTISAKIERLRQRVAKQAASGKIAPELAGVLSGFLDLLEDEL